MRTFKQDVCEGIKYWDYGECKRGAKAAFKREVGVNPDRCFIEHGDMLCTPSGRLIEFKSLSELAQDCIKSRKYRIHFAVRRKV